jgi:hypothetical protein
MKFRVQQVARGFWRERYLFCIQAATSDKWQCRDVSRGQLDKELRSVASRTIATRTISKLDSPSVTTVWQRVRGVRPGL